MGFEIWNQLGSKINGVSKLRKGKSQKLSKAGSSKNGSRSGQVEKSSKKRKKASRSNQALAEKGPSREQELRWRAENDAGTLMEASKILDDPARVNRAKRMAQEKAQAAEEAAEAVKNIKT